MSAACQPSNFPRTARRMLPGPGSCRWDSGVAGFRPPSHRWLYPLTLLGCIFLASGGSEVAGPGIPGSDKLAHYFVFGALATGAVRLVERRQAFWVVLAVSLYGASDEWHQSFTAGRSVEFADWLADTLGAMTAVWAYHGWPLYRRILETPLRFRRRKPCIENSGNDRSNVTE